MQALVRQGLSRSYARCFAEFLNEASPNHLGILYPETCVGLRYGHHNLRNRNFLVSLTHSNLPKAGFHSCFTLICIRTRHLDTYSHENAKAIMPRLSIHSCSGTGISTCCPSSTPFGLDLGPTNPGAISVAQETLSLRCYNFSS